jgi:hypothetical protein
LKGFFHPECSSIQIVKEVGMVVIDEGRRERPALSAPEAAVILRGPKVGDSAVLTLALQELVARGYLRLVVAVEPRRIGPLKRIAVLTPGSTGGRASNCVLDAVLAVLASAQPFQARSTHQEIEEQLAETLKMAGTGASLRKTLGAAMQVFKTDAQALYSHTYRDGTTGVPVSELALAIFHRYPNKGWYGGRTEGFVRGAVLPSLVDRGLYTVDRKLTSCGKDIRAQLKAELRVGWRARRTQRALANGLCALTPGADVERAFTAIKRGVESGWDAKYGGD